LQVTSAKPFIFLGHRSYKKKVFEVMRITRDLV